MTLKEKRNEFKNLKYNEWYLKEIKKYAHCQYNVERTTKNGTLLTGFELHHIVALKNGGTNEPSNLIWLPKAIHKLMVNKERIYNTRDKVLKFCNEYITNEKELSEEQFKKCYENNADKIKERSRKYWEQNKNKVKEKNSKYYKQNKDKSKEYRKQRYKQNKNKELERQKQYNKSKNGSIRMYKMNTKKWFKKSKKLKSKMTNLFKYECLCNFETENVYWYYDEEQHKLIWDIN